MSFQSLFQDAFLRSFTDTTSESYLSSIVQTLKKGVKVPLDETQISVEFLESVAQIRFSLSVVADVLKQHISSKQKVTLSLQAQQLVSTAHNICSDSKINVIDTTGQCDTTGPVVYLMRLLVRQYGMPCLENVAKRYSWVIPRQLTSTQEVNKQQF